MKLLQVLLAWPWLAAADGGRHHGVARVSGRVLEQQDAQRRTVELEMRLAELSGSLQSFAAQAQGNTVHLQRTLDERLDAVGQRVGVGLHEQAERTALSLGH